MELAISGSEASRAFELDVEIGGLMVAAAAPGSFRDGRAASGGEFLRAV
jgi:hypothetical protein